MDITNQEKDRFNKLLQDRGLLSRDVYVVAIAGIGGSGETTLHQLVFNNPRTDAMYNFKAWITVGDAFDTSQITKSILMSSGYSFKDDVDDGSSDLNCLQRDLFKLIAWKRFLIVLHDIHRIKSKDSWELLLLSLRSAAKRSCLVVTTNNNKVAEMIRPTFTLHSRHYRLFGSFFDACCHVDLPPVLNYAQRVLNKNPVASSPWLNCFSALYELKYVNHFKGSIRINFGNGMRQKWLSKGKGIPGIVGHLSGMPGINGDYAEPRIIFPNFPNLFIGRDNNRHSVTSMISNNSIASKAFSIAFMVLNRGVGKTMISQYAYNHRDRLEMCFDIHFWVTAIQDFACYPEATDAIMEFLANEFLADFRDEKSWQMVQHGSSPTKFRGSTNFMLSKNFWERIEKMKQRRTLFIFELEHVDSECVDTLAYHLQKEEYLYKLSLQWSATPNDPQKAATVLIALKPHTTLRRLTIQNYQGTSLPDWVADPAFCWLTSLHLHNFPNCTSLPSFSKLRSLVYLSVKNFNRLENLGPEFYGEYSSEITPFQALKIMDFEDLPEWRTWVPDELPVLEELYLVECPQLIGNLPDELPTLKKLEILDCEQLNMSLPQLPQITELKLQNCELLNLASIVNLSSLVSLDLFFSDENRSFTPNLGILTSLTELRIAGYHNFCNFDELQLPNTLDTFFISNPVGISYSFDEELPSLNTVRNIPPSLTSLSIGGFKDLDLPQHSYESLQYLSIHDFHLSEPLYFPLGNFSMLEYLEIKNCFNLESFDITSKKHETCLPFLSELSIDNCPHLLSFSRESFIAPKLITLSISNCKSLLSLPEGMHTGITSLVSLSLKDCPNLNSFPKAGLPPSLQTLRVKYCKRLTSRWREWKLEQLSCLKRLEIQGCEEAVCFPSEGWLPVSLSTLIIAHFPDLVFLIGESLRQLTSLKELEIMYCQDLLSLPEEGMPPSLEYLGIYFCPLLKERCQRDVGEDWPKISHLRRVNIDVQEI